MSSSMSTCGSSARSIASESCGPQPSTSATATEGSARGVELLPRPRRYPNAQHTWCPEKATDVTQRDTTVNFYAVPSEEVLEWLTVRGLSLVVQAQAMI